MCIYNMVYCIIIDLNLRNCQMCVLFMRWKEQMKMCLCHWSVHRQWSEGQPDDWKSHGLGEEGEDCGHIKWSGKLNDAHCSMKYRYACKVTFLEWGKEVCPEKGPAENISLVCFVLCTFTFTQMLLTNLLVSFEIFFHWDSNPWPYVPQHSNAMLQLGF